MRVGKTTSFPSALAQVPRNSPARALWTNYKAPPPVNEENSDDEEDNEVAVPVANTAGSAFNAHVEHMMKKPLKQLTSDEAIASGLRASLMTKEQRRAEPFVGVYNEMFPGIFTYPKWYLYMLSSILLYPKWYLYTLSSILLYPKWHKNIPRRISFVAARH